MQSSDRPEPPQPQDSRRGSPRAGAHNWWVRQRLQDLVPADRLIVTDVGVMVLFVAGGEAEEDQPPGSPQQPS